MTEIDEHRVILESKTETNETLGSVVVFVDDRTHV
jgi:hypothetical protein